MDKNFKVGDVVYFEDQLGMVVEVKNHIEEDSQIWKDLDVDPFSDSQDLWLDVGEFSKIDGTPEYRFINSENVQVCSY